MHTVSDLSAVNSLKGPSMLGLVSDWVELPYPGERPRGSWRLAGDRVHAFSGDLPPREWILAYGSNANPEKLHRKGFDGVIALESEITDAQAVWSGTRRLSGEVVATIIPAPGNVEVCTILGVTPAQLDTMDAWEGHPVRYRRGRFWGKCVVGDAWVYVGTPEVRPPLLVNGAPVGLHEMTYAEVNALVPAVTCTS